MFAACMLTCICSSSWWWTASAISICSVVGFLCQSRFVLTEHHVRSQGCLLVLVAPGHPGTKVINQLYCCVVWPQSVWRGHSGEERDWAEDSAHLVSIHSCQENDFGPDRELCTELAQRLESDSAVPRWAGGGQRLCRQLWDLGVWDHRDNEPDDYRVIVCAVCVVFHSLIHLFIYKTHLSIWSNKQTIKNAAGRKCDCLSHVILL